jgi:hypothetical protein
VASVAGFSSRRLMLRHTAGDLLQEDPVSDQSAAGRRQDRDDEDAREVEAAAARDNGAADCPGDRRQDRQKRRELESLDAHLGGR